MVWLVPYFVCIDNQALPLTFTQNAAMPGFAAPVSFDTVVSNQEHAAARGDIEANAIDHSSALAS